MNDKKIYEEMYELFNELERLQEKLSKEEKKKANEFHGLFMHIDDSIKYGKTAILAFQKRMEQDA